VHIICAHCVTVTVEKIGFQRGSELLELYPYGCWLYDH